MSEQMQIDPTKIDMTAFDGRPGKLIETVGTRTREEVLETYPSLVNELLPGEAFRVTHRWQPNGSTLVSFEPLDGATPLEVKIRTEA